MTSTLEPLLPIELPSRYDRWRARVAADPRLTRLYAWLPPVFVTVLAGILRFWNLGHPHALVFDETYYVKDAWSQWNLGYPGTWPKGADAQFADGATDIFTTNPSFAVHPPLGKWLIGAGMALFGPDNSFGWRFSTALFGTALVLLLFFVARTLTRSTVFATVASLMLAIDGLGIVMSRIALLDVFLAFFTLLAFWFVLRDRDRSFDRLLAVTVARESEGRAPTLGPVLWNRPWIIAAGAAAGAATAVKWSGVWVLAAIGLYLVVTDALERRRIGIVYWPTGALRQGAASFVLLVPVAFVVYLASWTGWLVTDGGYDRHAADADPLTGFFSWMPLPLQSLWRYHQAIYASVSNITSPHSYESPAWQWPLLWRPTAMYSSATANGQQDCTGGDGGCLQIVYSMPNPLLWYAAVAAAIYLLYRFVVRRDWRDAIILVAVAATWLPWLMYPERTVFQFYTVAIWPFLLLALTFALRDIAGAPDAGAARRLTGQRVVAIFLGFVVALSIFWYPLWSGIEVPYWFYRLHNWMQGWV